jgi:DNA-binding SARP family transcriptional activator
MLRIQLFGSFQVSAVDKPIARLQSERLQALLAYLVLRRDQSLSRQQLAVTFWPDTTDAQARTNLRTLIARLREALIRSILGTSPNGAATHLPTTDRPSGVDTIALTHRAVSRRLAARLLR